MSALPPDGEAPRRRARRFLALSVGVPLALVAGELAWRAWSAIEGRAYDSTTAKERMRALVSAMTEPLPRAHAENSPATSGAEEAHVLQPYWGFDFASNLDTVEEHAQRFRDGAYDDAFVVVLLGGSVCAIVGNEEHDRIVAAIAGDPRLAGRRVEVINQGRGAFKEPQQATLLVYLLAAGWRPDAVVEIDGFNEVAIPQGHVATGVHPLQPMWGQWGLVAGDVADRARELELASDCVLLQREAKAYADRALASGRMRSAVLGEHALAHVAELQRRWSEAQERYATWLRDDPSRAAARGPRFAPAGDAAIAAFVAAWEECSRSLAAICSERGVAYLHVLQPTMHDAGSKTLTAEELAVAGAPKPWITGVEKGYPMLREAGRRLAARGVAFADLSGVFRDLRETTYYDLCHFKGRGAELFADEVVRALLAAMPRTIPARRAWSRSR